jgi:FtsH-binding integral membrane protein
MPAKWFNSRTYGLMALPLGISGILSIAISQLYLSADSLFALPLLVLGLFLVVVSVVLLFFFFTMQWRWSHGQPQPRPLG